jgi:3-hydroxybutyryl-CoA dehydrogenase
MEISKIAIVGAGTMGANIALNFAVHGRHVSLHDLQETQLRKAMEIVRAGAVLLENHGLLNEPVDRVIARIVCESRLDAAVREAELVIEAVAERFQLKCQLFRRIDGLCGPDAILASNTSTFEPSRLALGLLHDERKKRFLVMHYWNPAHLMPLVELVPHPEALPQILGSISELLTQCGKTPVLVRKEIPGFIGNRLAFALQREAMDLIVKGVASPEDIDLVAKNGFGRRIPVSGIFGTADLGGLDVYLEVSRLLFPQLCNESAPPKALQRLVDRGDLGIKSGTGWKQYSSREIATIREALTAELIHRLKRDQATDHALALNAQQSRVV